LLPVEYILHGKSSSPLRKYDDTTVVGLLQGRRTNFTAVFRGKVRVSQWGYWNTESGSGMQKAEAKKTTCRLYHTAGDRYNVMLLSWEISFPTDGD